MSHDGTTSHPTAPQAPRTHPGPHLQQAATRREGSAASGGAKA